MTISRRASAADILNFGVILGANDRNEATV